MNNTDDPAPSRRATAVIGMAGRFPGARNVSELWTNLRSGAESIIDLADNDLKAAGIASNILQDPNYVKRVAPLENIDGFDASFFKLSPKDAAIMDPQHRLFLESAWEALEHAGWEPDEFPGSIGVFAGSGMNTYLLYNLLPNEKLMSTVGLFLIKLTGNDKDRLATRVSYQLNLTGPSMSIQTGCSTSLVAIHVACQSLLNHECDMALAGGVSIEIPHRVGYLYREGEILSRDGHCRVFDAGSTGTVFGSGAGVVVLRRLEDALKDRDCIHAVILGSAINNDGSRKGGYLAPSVSGQTEVVLKALSIAGVKAESISYVETHGVGTVSGDPIELTALCEAFRQSTGKRGYCAIGSLKTNIGHLDTAAGVAGLIKTVLALENKELPQTLHFSHPNSLIDFENSPFYVNTKLSEWKSETGPRRAGVTSLGVGGTNAHVILEQAPAREEAGAARRWQTLTVSAKTATALESASTQLAEYLARHPNLNLSDVAYTCHRGRKSFAQRRAVVCASLPEGIEAIRRGNPQRVFSGLAKSKFSTVFLFPGQGCQYVGMGEDLYHDEPDFYSQVNLCCEILGPQLGLDLRTILYPSAEQRLEAVELLGQTWITQPALFVVEFALAKLLMSWGIHPNAMIGHSLGEFVAASLSGVLSLEAALCAIATRGRLMQNLPFGVMLAVEIPEPEVRSLIGHDISLAAINAPDQVVLSGPADAIDKLEKSLLRAGRSYHRLRTSHAFHSPSTDSILGPFVDMMRSLAFGSPAIPFISSLTGDWIKPEEATDPMYWALQMRQTVRFSEGLRQVLNQSPEAFVEVGPGRPLAQLTQRHLAKADHRRVLGSLRSPQGTTGDGQYLIETISQLWASGAAVDWAAFHAHERLHRVPLPTYPFERQRYWIEAPKHASATAERNETAAPSETRPPFSRHLPALGKSKLVLSVLKINDREDKFQKSFEASADRGSPDAKSRGSGADRDVIESDLAEWWQDLLGVDAVKPQDDFFELGGHSLIAVRLLAKIKQVYGVDLTLSTLFKARTVEQLSLAIRASDRPLSQCLVPIQPTGSTPPLFCVHGVSGEVMFCHRIVRHLDRELPVYGIVASGVAPNSKRFSSIERMAQHYVREIKTLQPVGPYRLCGFSFGGFVAYEMARQLESLGHQDSLLVILDAVVRDFRTSGSLAAHGSRIGRYLCYHFSILQSGHCGGRFGYIRRRMTILRERVSFKIQKALGEWVDPKRRHLTVTLRKAFHRYRPKPYRGNVTLFRACDRIDPTIDSQNGWGPLALGGLQIYEFNTNHHSLIQEPSAREVAMKLTELLSNGRANQPPARFGADGSL